MFPNQFGFRAGCSTIHALISITQVINKTIDNQQFRGGVSIDLKKTFNDFYPQIPGSLEHIPLLFYKLNLLNIFDIYKFQLGKLVYDSLNNIVSEIHSHSTQFSMCCKLHANSVRTCRFGLRSLNIKCHF